MHLFHPADWYRTGQHQEFVFGSDGILRTPDGKAVTPPAPDLLPILHGAPTEAVYLPEVYAPRSEAWYEVRLSPRAGAGERDVYLREITTHIRAESEIPDDPKAVALAIFDARGELLSYSEPLRRLFDPEPARPDASLLAVRAGLASDARSLHPAQWERALSGDRTARLFFEPTHAAARREALLESFLWRSQLDIDIVSRMQLKMREVRRFDGREVLARPGSERVFITRDNLSLLTRSELIRTKFDGVHRALLQRYMEETPPPLGMSWNDYLVARRKSGDMPSAGGRDRRYDYLLVLMEHEQLGYFYPKHPLTDAELVLHSCDAIYDDLVGRGNESSPGKKFSDSLATNTDGEVVRHRVSTRDAHPEGIVNPRAGSGSSRRSTTCQPEFLLELAPAPDELTHEPSDIEVEALARGLYEHDPYSALYWFSVTVWDLSHYQVLRVFGAGHLDGEGTELGRLRKQLDRKLPVWNEITQGWAQEEAMRQEYGRSIALEEAEHSPEMSMDAELAAARRAFYDRNPQMLPGKMAKPERKDTGVKKDYASRLARVEESLQRRHQVR